MAGFQHRCTNRKECRKVVTLKRKIEHYIRVPKCPDCGGALRYEKRKETITCRCDGYHYPHRKGSPYCIHNPNYEDNWSKLYE